MTDWLDGPDGRRVAAEIGALIDARRGELIDLLAALVAEASPNPPGDCSGVSRVLSSWLGARGVALTSVARHPSKPNLIAMVSGPQIASTAIPEFR